MQLVEKRRHLYWEKLKLGKNEKNEIRKEKEKNCNDHRK